MSLLIHVTDKLLLAHLAIPHLQVTSTDFELLKVKQ